MSALSLRVRASIEAFACGDALGMPTEFMTRRAIAEKFGIVSELLPQEASQNHSDLPSGSVTDDTEQNLWLLRAYREAGELTVENTTAALLSWIRETGAVEKHYIGPSSKRALEAVEAGADPHTAGMSGTTCGGVMRVPSVVWLDPRAEEETLVSRVVTCLMPTHNTWEALEAAGAYAFALRTALLGGTRAEILAAMLRGAKRVSASAPYESCAPSSAARVEDMQARMRGLTDEALLDLLFTVYGTGLPSADVCAAAFALYLAADGSAWRAIRLGASLGGDTDTIAALAGALTAAEQGTHDVPDCVLTKVLGLNRLDPGGLTEGID